MHKSIVGMCNSESISQQISLFRSLVHNRRFDDRTLHILESVLIIRDVKLLLDVRSSVIEFMRHESPCVLREVKEKSVDHQLLILEFFVRAFALTGDVESCLALRYEGLVLRELKSVTDHWLQVSYREWFTFAEHALENKFYAIARKACEKALACFETNDMIKTKDTNALSEDMEAIRKVKRLKDIAMVRAASQSGTSITLSGVCMDGLGSSENDSYCEKGKKGFPPSDQFIIEENTILHTNEIHQINFLLKRNSWAQAVEYLERKIDKHDKVSMPISEEKRHSASVLFRNGIKKHNTQKLQELRRL